MSQKLNRTKLTKSRNRNHYDPYDNYIISTPSKLQSQAQTLPSPSKQDNTNHYDISTPISEYFPIEIAQLLSTNIQNGYNQSLQSQPTKLVKSVSDCGNFNDLNWFNCSPHDQTHVDHGNIDTPVDINIAYNNYNNNDNSTNPSHSQKRSWTIPTLTTIPSTGSNFDNYNDYIIDDEDDEGEIFELQLPEMGESTDNESPRFESPPPVNYNIDTIMNDIESSPPLTAMSILPPPSLAPIKMDCLEQTEAPSTPYQGLFLDLNEDECNHTSISKDGDTSYSNEHINMDHKPASFQPLITGRDEIMITYHDDDDKAMESDTEEYDDDNDDIEFVNFKEDYMEYSTKNTVNNIGTGASGIVTKAFHYNSCKMVAIKLCRSKQKHESLSFVKEAKLYQKYNHPNIVSILDFGRDIAKNGELKMALEYMDLGSSDNLNIPQCITDWRYRENIVGHIILNLLNGLNELHKNNYIHNDIKPANILCNKYGEIKLSDFGLVARLNSKQRYIFKKNCGTQRYQAYEKLMISPPRYNTKSDIWSVGTTAFELLFGAINGDNENWFVYGNAQKILNDSNHRNNNDGHLPLHFLSSDCCDFINKCLIVDDESRPNIDTLLQHPWLQYIATVDMKYKWPWIKLIDNKQINDNELYNIDPFNNNNNNNSKKLKEMEKQEMKRRLVPFECISQQFSDISISENECNDNNNSNNNNNRDYNDDLLFMISALVIHYCKKNIDLTPNGSLMNNKSMHRIQNESGYCDDERISNIAHYALCSKKLVIDRIKRTVYYIKSQLNNPEISRIDS